VETRVDEIAERIYRLSTFLPAVGPKGLTFNQFLVDADQPLLFHCGQRSLYPAVSQAVARVLDVRRLRWIAFSHIEADECGSLNEWLAVAPRAIPVCSKVAAMTSINDLADRPPRALADGETLSLGAHVMRWFDTPHLPHAWECGFMMEQNTRTLMCGDLFTQGGVGAQAITESDILGPSEALRHGLDYFSHARNTREMLEGLASAEPTTLACMHGSAWHGDGASLLRALADALDR
jgi:flavorubredoxin